MVVVSDTSPIRALQAIGLVQVLGDLFGLVLIPPAVARELTVNIDAIGPFDPSKYPFVRIQAPTRSLPRPVPVALGPGETEALALALELHADRVLIDERTARQVARSFGLPTSGVLAVLVEAKAHGLVPQVAPLLDRLQDAIDFRFSAALRDRILRDAGEA